MSITVASAFCFANFIVISKLKTANTSVNRTLRHKGRRSAGYLGVRGLGLVAAPREK